MSLTRRQFLKIGMEVFAVLGIGNASKELLADELSGGHQEAGLAKSLADNVAAFPPTIVSPSGRVSKLDRARLLIFFRKPIERKTIEKSLSNAGAFLEDADPKGVHSKNIPLQKVTHLPRRYWVRLPSGQAFNQQNVNDLIQSLPPTLTMIGAVYQSPLKEGPKGLFSPMPHVLIIKTVPKVDEASLVKVLGQFNLKEVPRKSKVGGGYRYFTLKDPSHQTVYALPQRLLAEHGTLIAEAHFEKLYLVSRAAHVPHDRLYRQNEAYNGQWNLRQISAERAWDVWMELGAAANPTIVCVIDAGCDLGHLDLVNSYANNTTVLDDRGLPVDDSLQPGQAPNSEVHGTNCAGIIAAKMDSAENPEGIAGLGANCKIMSVAADEMAFEVAQAIMHAADNGAKVISYSYAYDNWNEGHPDSVVDTTPVNAAIEYALQKGLVFCAATGNAGGAVSYPASHGGVIACGASNHSDTRCDTTDWPPPYQGSNFGDEISVVAPGINIPTTTNTGTAPSVLQGSKDYVSNFLGTSAATPHVAGLAALLFGRYPTLTGKQVRNIIERTADKINPKTADNPVNGYDYQEKLNPIVPAPNPIPEAGGVQYTNGTWCREVGYGRINAYHAMDLADVMIKGMSGDDGVEPFAPNGDFTVDTGDIVVFAGAAPANDDDAFLEDSKKRTMTLLADNHLYVRAFNLGPHEARNVKITARLVKGIRPLIGGWDFDYSAWSAEDATHLPPTPDPSTSNFPTVPSDGHVIAKFKISSAQVKTCEDWIKGSAGVHLPFVLAEVTADNDYAYDKADMTGSRIGFRRNNLAFRQLSVAMPVVIGPP